MAVAYTVVTLAGIASAVILVVWVMGGADAVDGCLKRRHERRMAVLEIRKLRLDIERLTGRAPRSA